MIVKFLKWLVSFLDRSSPKEVEMKYIPLHELDIELLKELEPTMQDKFLKVCLDALDTDPSTPDIVKDEFGCADTISALLKKVLPDFPIILSTRDLDFKLFSDKRFERLSEPIKGGIIVSPRTSTTFGHTGVFITSDGIA